MLFEKAAGIDEQDSCPSSKWKISAKFGTELVGVQNGEGGACMAGRGGQEGTDSVEGGRKRMEITHSSNAGESQRESGLGLAKGIPGMEGKCYYEKWLEPNHHLQASGMRMGNSENERCESRASSGKISGGGGKHSLAKKGKWKFGVTNNQTRRER